VRQGFRQPLVPDRRREMVPPVERQDGVRQCEPRLRMIALDESIGRPLGARAERLAAKHQPRAAIE
jgi:hypothetical protein